MRNRPAVLAGIAALSALPAWAQVVQEMTPALIQEAIERGKESCYSLKSSAVHAGFFGVEIACFTTPYSRVVGAAKAAKKKYKPFTAADVTQEMLVPEVHILVPAFVDASEQGAAASNVEAVVIMPKGSKDRTQALHPSASGELTAEFKNLAGAEWEGRGIRATFPLSVLSEANEVHVVYDGGTMCKNNDCAVRFKLEKVR
jgi:hypothetical protein